MPKSAIRNPQSAIRNRIAPLVSAERVRAFIRSRFNPIRSLTPELLSQYLDAFKAGYLRQCALCWDAIAERDDILASVVPKRAAAAARHGWEILTLDSIPPERTAEAESHKAALNAFYSNLTVTNAIDENERGEVSLLLRQMMSAVGNCYAVHEIVWRPGAASNPSIPSDSGLTAELRFVPLWFFENTTGRLRYLAAEGAINGVPMDDESWLVSVGQGLMFACSVAYIYKTMSLKDWVIYNERHGMPGIHGKTDAAKDSDEWDTLVTAVQNFAADWAMVTNSGATIEKLDMSSSGPLPYAPLVERMDRALAAIWRGADLSTISAGQSDAGQGASLQGAESETLEEDDAAWLSETLSRQLDRRVIEFVFGRGVQPLAYIKIKTAQKKDTDLDIRIDDFLLRAGAPIPVQSALERYNRPMPDPAAALLSAPQIVNPQSAIHSVPASQPGHQPSGAAGYRPGVKTGAPAAPGSAGPLANQRVRDQKSDVSNVGAASVPRSPDQPAVGQLLAAARMELAAAQEEVLQPLRAELERILAVPDSDLQSAIRNLQSELPALLLRINASPATAKVLEETLSAAIVSGMSA